MRELKILLLAFVIGLLGACGSPAPRPEGTAAAGNISQPGGGAQRRIGSEVVLFAMSLLDTGYRFGGKNPEAGLDCSGMVSYIYQQAAGIRLSGSAADIARRGRAVERAALQPGDLVFFNTSGRPYSHVGIYIGDARFVHAPSSNGKVRVDHLEDRYYARRFESARTLLD